jgi:type II secretion system protein H
LNKQIYIGSTNDFKSRLAGHNRGEAVSTRRYRPWALFYYEAYSSEKPARLREKRLKYNGNALRELRRRIGLFKSGAGFTLLEVLLVIGLLGLLVALAIPFYQSFQVSSELDNVAQELVQTLRLAQAKAMASEGWQPFGVHLEENKFVLFQGPVYRADDPFNEETTVAGVLSISYEHQETVFNAITGTTLNIGRISISSTNSRSRNLIINELGVVNEF